LNEVEKNDKETLKELFSIISDLKQEIKIIKKENVNLKEKIKNLETFIPYLKEYKKKSRRKQKQIHKTIRKFNN
jgi:predicted  nucleic acid-binding Zn-ribbon protein